MFESLGTHQILRAVAERFTQHAQNVWSTDTVSSTLTGPTRVFVFWFYFYFPIFKNVCIIVLGLCCLHSQPATRTPPINRPERVRTSSWVQGKQENKPNVFWTPGL